MTLAESEVDLGSVPDLAYPTITPPDPIYPCQTLAPLAAPLDGVAMPFIWSRLKSPLERALLETWRRLGLLQRARPSCWVTIHCGRIAINAHGWERLRARLAAEEPDPGLVEPPPGLSGVADRWERLRARFSTRALLARLGRAEAVGERALIRAATTNPSELDTAELARGPLDDHAWTEILLPWFGKRLRGEDARHASVRLQASIGLEQQIGAELGRRLAGRGVLTNPVDVVYLTVEERIRAVHEASDHWSKLAAARAQRINGFLELDLPETFWGRPRVDYEKTG